MAPMEEAQFQRSSERHMGLLESIFGKFTLTDKRRARRFDSPPLVAYYWDGNTPSAHPIQNVSADGFYLLTAEQIRPGTVINVTLQRSARNGEDSSSLPHITVMSRVVWQGEDGVGFAFIPQEADQRQHLAGRKAISRFLEETKAHADRMSIKFFAEHVKQTSSNQKAVLPGPGGFAMKRLGDESGQALIISVLSMTCIFGFCALAADVGIMLRAKRQAQTAADAAAIAGALELNFYPSGVTSAALAAAGQNGFAAASSGVTTASGVTVTINNGPDFGPHASPGTPNGYIEAIVSVQQPTLFMGLFGIFNMTPTARAVAWNGGSAQSCVVITNPSASPAFNLQGSFDVTTPNCGIVVDSNQPGALNFTGAGGTLTAGSIGVAGTCTGHCTDSTPAPVTGMVPVSDPLAKLQPSFPTPSGCTAGGSLTGPIAAGCYSGDASGNLTVSSGNFSGMFVFTGSGTLTLSGTTTSDTTNGATIDLVSGSLTESTNTTIAWTPTQSGTFQGMAIMAPTTNTTGTLNFSIGDATGTLDGIIYAPGMAMTMQDHGGSGKKGGLTLVTDLIVNTLSDTSALLNLSSYTQQNPGASPLTKVTLVE